MFYSKQLEMNTVPEREWIKNDSKEWMRKIQSQHEDAFNGQFADMQKHILRNVNHLPSDRELYLRKAKLEDKLYTRQIAAMQHHIAMYNSQTQQYKLQREELEFARHQEATQIREPKTPDPSLASSSSHHVPDLPEDLNPNQKEEVLDPVLQNPSTPLTPCETPPDPEPSTIAASPEDC